LVLPLRFQDTLLGMQYTINKEKKDKMNLKQYIELLELELSITNHIDDRRMEIDHLPKGDQILVGSHVLHQADLLKISLYVAKAFSTKGHI